MPIFGTGLSSFSWGYAPNLGGAGSKAFSSCACMSRHSEMVSNTIVCGLTGENGFQSSPGCDGLPVRAKLTQARDTLSWSE